MKVTIDHSQLTAEAKRSAALRPEVRARSWKIVRAQAFKLETGVKLRMPVDTGRARASWGHSTAPASPSDGIWDEDEADLSIVEGTAVDYVAYLNEGSSSQAPAGFIDAEAFKVEAELNAAIDALIRETF